jgi:glycosidase
MYFCLKKLGDFDLPRLSSSFSNNKQLRLVHALCLLLKGTPVILAGDELEMQVTNEAENYMQWDNSNGCGFTDNVEVGSFLKNITNCKNNVQSALAHGSQESLIRIYKRISKLRNEVSFSSGDIIFNSKNNTIISFVRQVKGSRQGYLIAANMNEQLSGVIVNFKQKHDLPSKGHVEYFYSIDHHKDHNDKDEFVQSKELNLENIYLKKGQLLVIKFKHGD